MSGEINHLNTEQFNRMENCPEIPRGDWQTVIFWQRHGQYDTRRPVDWAHPNEEERTFGHLTEQGKQDVINRTRQRLEVILLENPDKIDFLLVNSPTFWLDRPELGQRAQETADLILETIREELLRRELNPNQILNLNESRHLKGESSRPDEKIEEARMFQVPEFVGFMRERYDEQGADFWQAWFQDKDRETRETLNAEGPAEIAQRLHEMARIEARYARMYRVSNPNRRLFIWNVTHGDGLVPYAQRVLGMPETEFTASYNDGIGMIVEENGVGSAIINGHEYQTRLDIPTYRDQYQDPMRD